MTVKDLLDLFPTGQSYRFVVNSQWRDHGCKNDNDYNRVLEYYKDYNVIGVETYLDVLWLNVEKPVDDNPYRILDYAIFEKSMFEYLETYKHYTILKASINPHNSEYVIQELGFETVWSSLAYCKKYIKEQLVKK